MFFHWLVVSCCLHFVEALFRCYFFFCPCNTDLVDLDSFVFGSPILPPVCCMHFGPHLVWQSVTVFVTTICKKILLWLFYTVWFWVIKMYQTCLPTGPRQLVSLHEYCIVAEMDRVLDPSTWVRVQILLVKIYSVTSKSSSVDMLLE